MAKFIEIQISDADEVNQLNAEFIVINLGRVVYLQEDNWLWYDDADNGIGYNLTPEDALRVREAMGLPEEPPEALLAPLTFEDVPA